MSHTKLVGRFTVSRNSSDAENHCLDSTNRINCLQRAHGWAMIGELPTPTGTSSLII